MRPQRNIDFEVIGVSQDDEARTYKITWYKAGLPIRIMELPYDTLNAATPFCTGCLLHRGELIRMREPHGTHVRCHVCGGLWSPETRTSCSCGEIPHTEGCSMGFGYYFGRG